MNKIEITNICEILCNYLFIGSYSYIPVKYSFNDLKTSIGGN